MCGFSLNPPPPPPVYAPEHFRTDFEKCEEMCENLNYQRRYMITKTLGILPSSLWKVFLKVFLQVNPTPMRKPGNKASVLRAFSLLKRKKGCFCGDFFRLSANFRPYTGTIFHEITHIIFARYQHMINDDKRKKITTFSGKVFCSELP